MLTSIFLAAALVQAPEWNVAGPWGTPGALSLGGVNGEAELRPNAGDDYLSVNFDSVSDRKWLAVARRESVGYVAQTNVGGFAWTEGSAYSSVWLVSPDARTVTMRYTASGSAMSVWANGVRCAERDVVRTPLKKMKVRAKTDQGNEFDVEVTTGGMTASFDLPLAKGANRVLVKFYTRQPQGSDVVFDATFANADGVTFHTANPSVDAARHAQVMAFLSDVFVNAPGNLPHDDQPLSLTTRVEVRPPKKARKPKKGAKAVAAEPAEPAVVPFEATCEQVVSDYDGREVARKRFTMTLPGTNTVDYGVALPRGFYQVRTDVLDEKGEVLATLQPDGFSVIGGTAARRARQAQGLNKAASCFYWMNAKPATPQNTHSCENFFPWMARIGVLHNVGGSVSDTNLLARAKAFGVTLTADFLDPWCGERPEKRKLYAANAVAYTKLFKAWNEIDISPFRFKSSTTNWVKRVKSEWEAVHAADPKAIYTGPTLVRPAGCDWFAECLRLGWADYVDVWDVHAYPMYPPRLGDAHMANSVNESGPGLVTALKDVLGKANDKPFIMGEWGARASHGRNARRWQTDMVAKMVAWLGTTKAYLMGGFLVPWEHSWGDIAVGHQPAEAALYTACALVDGFPFSRFEGAGLERSKNFEAGLFGKTLMVWKSWGGPEAVTFAPPVAGDLVLVDVIGRVKPLPRDAQGRVTVTFSGSPVYVLPADEYRRLTE